MANVVTDIDLKLKVGRDRRRYDLIFWGGLVFFILENVYFGWNKVPESGAERICDFIVSVAVLYGVIGSIAQGVARSLIERTRIFTVLHTMSVATVNRHHNHEQGATCTPNCREEEVEAGKVGGSNGTGSGEGGATFTGAPTGGDTKNTAQ